MLKIQKRNGAGYLGLKFNCTQKVLTKPCRPTVYAVFALWFRCRTTLPQGKPRINCGWTWRLYDPFCQ